VTQAFKDMLLFTSNTDKFHIWYGLGYSSAQLLRAALDIRPNFEEDPWSQASNSIFTPSEATHHDYF